MNKKEHTVEYYLKTIERLKEQIKTLKKRERLLKKYLKAKIKDC